MFRYSHNRYCLQENWTHLDLEVSALFGLKNEQYFQRSLELCITVLKLSFYILINYLLLNNLI